MVIIIIIIYIAGALHISVAYIPILLTRFVIEFGLPSTVLPM